jgi:hypothetical protein
LKYSPKLLPAKTARLLTSRHYCSPSQRQSPGTGLLPLVQITIEAISYSAKITIIE